MKRLVIAITMLASSATFAQEHNTEHEFAYLGKRGDVLHFEGMPFRPERDAMTVWLAIGMKDGGREETFRYRRVGSR